MTHPTWLSRLPPVMPVSIVPKPQARPPLWLPISIIVVGLSPFFGLILWGLR